MYSKKSKIKNALTKVYCVKMNKQNQLAKIGIVVNLKLINKILFCLQYFVNVEKNVVHF